MRFHNKTAIVTGGSRGIGAAIATQLCSEGANVVITGRDAARLQQTVDQCDALEGTGVCIAVQAHMGDMDQVGRVVEETVTRFGGIDVIVNNAATNPIFGPILQSNHDAFNKIMDVNVRGPYELMLRAQPFLAKSGGAIVNISSVGGLSPEPMLGLYSMSKAALVSLTKVVAKEWGAAGIRANVVCPGLIKTKFSSALWTNESILQHVVDNQPLARAAEPEEVARLVCFLASEEASYCTGAVYTVDGGHSL